MTLKMKNIVGNLIYKEECYAILGACFAVYKDKGCGFLESVYQECFGDRVRTPFSVFSGQTRLC